MKRTSLCLLAAAALLWTGAALSFEDHIHRAQFTTAVQDREPVDEVSRLSTDHDRIIFYTEVRELEGAELTHRYLYEDEVEAEVPLSIGGPRWRTWSSKSLDPEKTGTWTVEVVDEEGETHGSWSFEYTDDPADDANDEDEDNGYE